MTAAHAATLGYDYTWEVYTPPARRVRGYYALPVLAGVELVGHIDPKADRANGKLAVVIAPSAAVTAPPLPCANSPDSLNLK